MENSITIDETTCKKCSICAEVCPNKIMIKDINGEIKLRRERIALCFKCGQCMAVCSTKSININGLDYENDFFQLPLYDINNFENNFFDIIRTRRAVRNFKDKQVPKELLEKIIEAITFAPPGFPPLKVKVTVIQNTEIIKQALPNMVKLYEMLFKIFKKPIYRFFIKKELGPTKFKTMQSHLIPMLTQKLPFMKDGSEDAITRNAPAMILFLADKNEEDICEDITIAATYAMLAAHSIGLGGSIMHIIPPAINKDKELRKLFKVENSEEVVNSIILGFPKYKYLRGIKRSLKSVKWL